MNKFIVNFVDQEIKHLMVSKHMILRKNEIILLSFPFFEQFKIVSINKEHF